MEARRAGIAFFWLLPPALSSFFLVQSEHVGVVGDVSDDGDGDDSWSICCSNRNCRSCVSWMRAICSICTRLNSKSNFSLSSPLLLVPELLPDSPSPSPVSTPSFPWLLLTIGPSSSSSSEAEEKLPGRWFVSLLYVAAVARPSRGVDVLP